MVRERSFNTAPEEKTKINVSKDIGKGKEREKDNNRPGTRCYSTSKNDHVNFFLTS